LPLARRVILTEANLERAAPLRQLRKKAEAFQKGCEEEPSVEQALSSALFNVPDDEVIVVAGSIFVVGEAKMFFSKHREVREKAMAREGTAQG